MRKILGRRPTPAMGVALVALSVALGGTAVAATVISGSQIRHGTITATRIQRESIDYTRLKKDGLGGVVIKESRLGEVPRAAHARTADTVDGVASRKLFYKSGVTDADTELLNLGGLRITAHCGAANGGTPIVRAFTSVDNAAVRSVSINGTSAPANTQSADFDTIDSLDVLAGQRNTAGTLTYYRPDGGVVTVTYAAEGSPSLGQATEGGVACSFAGTALQG